MKFKRIGLVIVFFFSAIAFSCHDESCPKKLPYFSVNGINNFIQNTQTQQLITKSNPTVWSNISYLIGLETSGVAQRTYSPNGSLLALDCIGYGYLGSKNGIMELEIISNSTYSTLIKAGDSASGLFAVEVLGELLSIEEFNLIYRENYNFTDFRLVLLEGPEYEGELQSFIILLKFVDGTAVETITDQIRILK